MAGWSLRGPLAAFLFLCLSQVVTAADGTVAQSLQVLARDGMDGTPAGLEMAEGAYQRARRAAPDDGRIDYAWSLVLTKHRQFGEAAEVLEKALAAKQVCLQAQSARIRGTLKSRKFAQALDELVELAEQTGDLQLAHLTREDRQETAAWIGRATAFLAGPLGDPEVAALVGRRETAIRTYLGSWQADYDRGQQELSLAHREHQDRLSLSMAEAEERRSEALRGNQEKRAKLEEAYKSAATEGAKARNSASETATDLKTQIDSLEKQFKNLLTAEERVTDTIFHLEHELDRLVGELQRLHRDHGGYPAAKRIYPMKIQETQIEIELMQTDLQNIRNEKAQLVNQAGAAQKNRFATLSEQQKLDFQKTHDAAKYQRLQRSLEEDARKVAASSPSKAGRAHTLRLRMQSWNTFDPSDPALELAQLAGL